MKITNKVENVFSYAVALNQSGRLRNTIYCIEDRIYIMNSDNTVLLRFSLGEETFEHPISFRANDYESRTFSIEGDKIVFETVEEGFLRKKYCGTPNMSIGDIEEIYRGFVTRDSDAPIVVLNKGLLKSLDESLSHIEFSGENGELKIVQRNVYDGSIIEVSKVKAKGLGMSTLIDKIPDNFGPIGIRTNDFIALFSFCDIIEMTILNEGHIPFRGRMSKLGSIEMDGIMSWCVYDEMGIVESILKEAHNGGEKQENRSSEQTVDRTACSRRTKGCGRRRTK